MHEEAQSPKYSKRNDCMNTTNAQKLKKRSGRRKSNFQIFKKTDLDFFFLVIKSYNSKGLFYTICHLHNSCLFVEFQEIQPSGYFLEQSQNTGLVYLLQEYKTYQLFICRTSKQIFFLKIFVEFCFVGQRFSINGYNYYNK